MFLTGKSSKHLVDFFKILFGRITVLMAIDALEIK